MSVEYKLNIYNELFNTKYQECKKFILAMINNQITTTPDNLDKLFRIINEIKELLNLGKEDVVCNKKIKELCKERTLLIGNNEGNKELDKICDEVNTK